MVNRCKAVGGEKYVDAVLNHMTSASGKAASINANVGIWDEFAIHQGAKLMAY
jgi:hypothetical protein